MSSDELADGVWTASAGNMAQSLAWCAREKRIPCSVVLPDTAVDKVAQVVALLVERNRVVAEGAGALPVAATIDGLAGTGRICCVVSGGNIDGSVLASILQGKIEPLS